MASSHVNPDGPVLARLELAGVDPDAACADEPEDAGAVLPATVVAEPDPEPDVVPL